MENEIVVVVRREITLRMRGDYVAQWVTVHDSIFVLPDVGRSLGTIERKIRQRIAKSDPARAAAVSIRFELDETVALGRRAAVSIQRAAREALAAAEAAFIDAICAALENLLEESPSLSLRDAVKLLGLSKSELQRIAVRCVDLDGKERIRARRKEKQDHIDALWAAMRARREARAGKR